MKKFRHLSLVLALILMFSAIPTHPLKLSKLTFGILGEAAKTMRLLPL